MKRQIITLVLVLTGIAVVASGQDAAEEVPIDPVTGMKMAENWQLVMAHCTVCHSPKQYLQQRGTKSTWTDIIKWMQKHGGLWPLDADTESKIVTYLAENYGPSGSFRRAPIPVSLLPKNPYLTGAKADFEEKKKAGKVPDAPGATKE